MIPRREDSPLARASFAPCAKLHLAIPSGWITVELLRTPDFDEAFHSLILLSSPFIFSVVLTQITG